MYDEGTLNCLYYHRVSNKLEIESLYLDFLFVFIYKQIPQVYALGKSYK